MTPKIRFGTVILACALAALAACKSPSHNSANIVKIEDDKFLDFLVNHVGADTDGDGKISIEEAEAVTEINNNWNTSNPIDNLAGLEAFVNLKVLDMSEPKNNTEFTFKAIDLSKLKKLETIKLTGHNLTDVVLGDKPELALYRMHFSATTELDLSQAPKLKKLELVASEDMNSNLTDIYVQTGIKAGADVWDVPDRINIIEVNPPAN